MAAFKTYEQYMQQFGGALQNAANPPQLGLAGPNPSMGGAFNPADMPPPQQGAPASAIPNASPTAPQPQASPAAGAFGAAPGGKETPPGPVVAPGTPAGAFGGSPSSSAPGASGEDGLTMKKLYDDSSDEEREELAKTMEQQVPGGDLVKAAKAAEELEPTLAEKWGVGEWDRKEAAAFLMEWGLRMMAASGSGEGNFFSDAGQAGLGATEARRAFRKEKTAEEIAAEDREWKQKTRGREEGQWSAEDRETRRERMRKSAAEERAKRAEERAGEKHKKEMDKPEARQWQTIYEEDGNVVFIDPNTGTKFDSGIKSRGRDADGRVSQFQEQLQMWQETAAGINGSKWEALTPEQQAQVNQAFFQYQKTGVNNKAARAQFVARWFDATMDSASGKDKRDPKFKENAKAAAQQMANELFGTEDGMGGIPVFSQGRRPPPGLKGEELAQWYIDNSEE
jgi:hypothetical protein